MVFSVWDASVGGTQVSTTIFRFDVPVNDGRFTVDLDFGGTVFNNDARFLNIRIGSTTLTPRVAFTRAPYAMQTRGIEVTDDGRVGIVANPASNISLAVAAGGNNHAMQAISVNDTEPTFFAFNVGDGPAISARGGSDASLGGGGLIVAGLTQSQNVSIDANEIMARDGGAASDLHLNREGGNIVIGDATAGSSRLVTPVLQITGGSDLSEMFNIGGNEKVEPGMVVVIDPENAGQLTPSTAAYDKKVAGIVSGAGNVATGMTMGQAGTIANGSYPVALTGRVYCWVDAAEHAIEPGDSLTTSATIGHAMKAINEQKMSGTVLGKAMTSLKKGERGLVLVLVNLQ